MIDWDAVVANAIWIFACSGILAVFSVALFDARSEHVKLASTFQKPAYNVLLNLGGCLFCLGQAAVIYDGSAWKAALWLVLALVFLFMVIFRLIRKK
jgi:predicted MFS family arabinose efflux permease